MPLREICTATASSMSTVDVEYGILSSSDCCTATADEDASCMTMKTSRIVIMSIMG
jgi:hypothetical protein